MANVNIPDLAALTAPAATDEIEVYDASAAANVRLALSYVALTGTANVFTANQRVDALVGVNVAPTASQQLTAKAGSTSTVGLVVDTAASPTANVAEWRVNGTEKISITKDGGLGLLTHDMTPYPAVAMATTTTHDVPIYQGLLLIRAWNGSQSPYYNTALILSANDAYNGAAIAIVGQNQSAQAETFYVGGATGLALTAVGGGGVGVRITNNFGYTVNISYVVLELSA